MRTVYLLHISEHCGDFREPWSHWTAGAYSTRDAATAAAYTLRSDRLRDRFSYRIEEVTIDATNPLRA